MRNTTRSAALRRRTRGTEVEIELKLDGAGMGGVHTEFEHLNVLLEMMSGYGGMDLKISQTMNEHADDGYAIDDLADALAEAMRRCLGERPKIRQFGTEILPVGDALVMVAVDVVSPAVFQLSTTFRAKQIEGMDVELIRRFLARFVDRLGASVHIRMLAGNTDVNKVRAIFLALGGSLATACEVADRDGAREVAVDVDYLETPRPPAVDGDEADFEEVGPPRRAAGEARSERPRRRRGRGAAPARADEPEPADESERVDEAEPADESQPAARRGARPTESASGESAASTGRRRGRRGGRGRRRGTAEATARPESSEEPGEEQASTAEPATPSRSRPAAGRGGARRGSRREGGESTRQPATTAVGVEAPPARPERQPAGALSGSTEEVLDFVTGQKEPASPSRAPVAARRGARGRRRR